MPLISAPVISVRNLRKTYVVGDVAVRALRRIDRELITS
jgi:hypothetical protein